MGHIAHSDQQSEHSVIQPHGSHQRLPAKAAKEPKAYRSQRLLNRYCHCYWWQYSCALADMKAAHKASLNSRWAVNSALHAVPLSLSISLCPVPNCTRVLDRGQYVHGLPADPAVDCCVLIPHKDGTEYSLTHVLWRNTKEAMCQRSYMIPAIRNCLLKETQQLPQPALHCVHLCTP
jgi:hypothetical protein